MDVIFHITKFDEVYSFFCFIRASLLLLLLQLLRSPLRRRSVCTRLSLCTPPVIVFAMSKRTCESFHESPAKRQSVRMPATPPTTPTKKRVVDISNTLQNATPLKKKLFTPPTPQKSIRSDTFLRAKSLFQRGSKITATNSSHLVSREKEGTILNEFLFENFYQRSCNSLYISGPPGTGKTAQVGMSLDHFLKSIGTVSRADPSIVHSHDKKRCVKMITMNCMTVSNPENIFHEIYNQIDAHSIVGNRKKSADDLYTLLQSREVAYDTVVLFLDEMDYLITRDQQVLFKLFQFASSNTTDLLSAKLVLVGISNSLDFTDKFLPRLKRNRLCPQSMQFLPYNAGQIRQIIMERLATLTEDKENGPAIPIIHPTAVQMCCVKAAAVAGDLRKAFDICYKSIELLEEECTKGKSQATVLISHVARVCNATFGDNLGQRLGKLNLLQKALLCCLVNLEANSAAHLASENKVNHLYEHYLKHCVPKVEQLLSTVKKGEFLELVSALEACGLVSLTAPKLGRGGFATAVVDTANAVIKSRVPLEMLSAAVSDVGVLKKLLYN